MDFVIVGGGVYGCGVAWELALRGAEALLLEKDAIAGGASGGLGRRGVRANGRDLRELPLMRMAYQRWASLHTATGSPTGYERCGHLLLIERESDLAGARAQVWAQEQQGIPTELIEAPALRAMEPHLGPQVKAAIYCPLDGIADHTATTRGLAGAAASLGAQIREGSEVVAIERLGDRVTAVITAEEERITIRESLLLLCNSHLPRLFADQFGVHLPVWTQFPQVVLTDRVDPMPVQHLIGHAHRLLAIKPNPDGKVMISGGWRGRWDQAVGRGVVRPDQVAGNLAEAQAVYPGLDGVQVSDAQADRPESIAYDGIPIIDRVPGLANAFFATGWSGHGWAIAPAVCHLLARWVIDGEMPELLRPFSYERFFSR